MKISIVGTGYVGLVTGTCFADVGNQVLCVDKDESKISLLENGVIPIYEPGLERLVKQNTASGRLKFTNELDKAIEFSDLLFIAVGTPPGEDGSADLSHVLAVAQEIGRNINSYKVIVTKSTVPVGTADRVRATIQAELDSRGLNTDFSVASNPEFLKEGAAIEDFMKPDRIVVGANDGRVIEVLKELYAPFNRNHDRLIVMDIPSAELTKYAANAMLATKISFMNELSNLAERLNADIELVRQGIGSDPRIGYHFIYPGCGYGGSCFPKDVQALYRTAEQKGYDAHLLAAVEKVNQQQKSVLLEKINRYFDDQLSGKRFALWGLAFKPNTDDMREAPSRVIIDGMVASGAEVIAYDPVAGEEAKKIYGNTQSVSIVNDMYDCINKADALILVTEWKEFRSPDFTRLEQSLVNKVIFDGRNIYDPENLSKLGFAYIGIGRKN